MRIKLIAPCGMNCGLCMAYLRDKKNCPGCRSTEINPFKSCNNCTIKNCEHLEKKNLKYCSSECEKYPCPRLKNLDKRYRAKYSMSMIDNLDTIVNTGIFNFIALEKQRWIRENMVYCVNNKQYYDSKKIEDILKK